MEASKRTSDLTSNEFCLFLSRQVFDNNMADIIPDEYPTVTYLASDQADEGRQVFAALVLHQHAIFAYALALPVHELLRSVHRISHPQHQL